MLTPRERECLVAIEEYIAAQSFPPTVREIAVALNVRSCGTVAVLLQGLSKKGYIASMPLAPRTIRVLRRSDAA
jgi:repressor LexA